MPVEGVKRAENFGSSISRIPLFRGDSQITRNYCAFWKQENSGYYVEEFADILKRKFEYTRFGERAVLMFKGALFVSVFLMGISRKSN